MTIKKFVRNYRNLLKQSRYFKDEEFIIAIKNRQENNDHYNSAQIWRGEYKDYVKLSSKKPEILEYEVGDWNTDEWDGTTGIFDLGITFYKDMSWEEIKELKNNLLKN